MFINIRPTLVMMTVAVTAFSASAQSSDNDNDAVPQFTISTVAIFKDEIL
jgi:hypothetical protein